MPFPVEAAPDGAPFAPHHFTYAVYIALILAAIAWDDFPKKEPVAVVGSLAFAWFGFIHTWAWYPAAGASMVLLGLAAASGALLRPAWNDWYRGIRYGVGIMILVAWDDALSHTFGIWTPIDWLWKAYVAGLIQ